MTAKLLVSRHQNEGTGTTVNSGTHCLVLIDRFRLLWRASVSTQDFYRRVSTGAFEHELRSMIANADPGAPDTFAVILARFDNPAYTTMLDPHRDRYDGINYFRFYLAGFVAYIKVDQRSPAGPLADCILRADAPITVLLRSTREGKDGAVMRELARSAWKRKQGG